MTIAFYPGSFDPPTLGHVDIIRRALQVFGKLTVGIGVHSSKTALFSDAERLDLVSESLRGLVSADRSDVDFFHGLAVDEARKRGTSVIIRGLRDASDFSYERQMAGMNAVMAPDIETVFLSASPQSSFITSTLVRQIARLGGDVSAFVSPAVATRIAEKMRRSNE